MTKENEHDNDKEVVRGGLRGEKVAAEKEG